jgi:short-subunit dehydrogenase
MLKRHQESNTKSAIVVTSSGLGGKPISGTVAYSAAKSFASFMAEALNVECKGKVDVMSYQAGEVTTKLLKKSKTDSRTITPEMAANCSFRDLGYQPLTYGASRHDFCMLFMEYLPLSLI